MFRQSTLQFERDEMVDTFRAFKITNDSTMGLFNTEDEETLALILQLQVEDANELSTACEGKGEGQERSLTDIQVRLQREEVECSMSILAYRKMTRSLARACQTDDMYNLCFTFFVLLPAPPMS